MERETDFKRLLAHVTLKNAEVEGGGNHFTCEQRKREVMEDLDFPLLRWREKGVTGGARVGFSNSASQLSSIAAHPRCLFLARALPLSHTAFTDKGRTQEVSGAVRSMLHCRCSCFPWPFFAYSGERVPHQGCQERCREPTGVVREDGRGVS